MYKYIVLSKLYEMRNKPCALKIMVFTWFQQLIFAVVCFFFLYHLKAKTVLTNWPVIGMLPSLLLNLHRLHDWATEILSTTECNFVFKGPWFTNMTNILVTSDPANIGYILNTNFTNYPKGSEFREFFDALGDGILNVDSDSWKVQRSIAHRLINQEKFQCFLQQAITDKLENALIPFLEHVLKQNIVVDLQDIFKRFMYDINAILFSGTDPGALCVEFSKLPYLDALDDAEEAIFHRHIVPMKWWKLQRFLGIGNEKKLTEAKRHLAEFIAQCISKNREMQSKKVEEEAKKGIDMLTSYMELDGSMSDEFLSDTVLNFMVAGRSTLSVALTWFFWLISKNPTCEAKIIEELMSKATFLEKEGRKLKMLDKKGLHELVYLNGALCEALRLFPPVPFLQKRPLRPDTLPSGHKVNSRVKIVPFLYSLGRMEKVWGENCLEFMPERWISEKGGIEYVSSHKFIAFNSGPRACLGQGIAFTIMRLVAATILYDYHVEVVENQVITPQNSIILYMKHGMNVRINGRF